MTRTVLALAACVCLTACALVQPPRRAAQAAPLGPGEIVSAQAAQNAVTVGKSTKADIRAALGEAVVVDFDSGYEVWVYRERPPAQPAQHKAAPRRKELVLLFAPSGVLTKMRVSERKST
jgi:outer membrane protein assembly factor BamE (lipoprotein component of BamABCDE complex)